MALTNHIIPSGGPRPATAAPARHGDLPGLPVWRHRGPRRTCLVVACDPTAPLPGSLLPQLAAEMPALEFTLDGAPGGGGAPRAVWLLGYEPGHAERVRALRARHPRATLVVTGRAELALWEPEVLASGADRACSWPASYRRLEALLGEPRHAAQVAGAG